MVPLSVVHEKLRPVMFRVYRKEPPMSPNLSYCEEYLLLRPRRAVNGKGLISSIQGIASGPSEAMTSSFHMSHLRFKVLPSSVGHSKPTQNMQPTHEPAA